MNPLLSVVIPTYNEANRIEKTLLALKNFLDTQSLEWELIISDDGSTDATCAKVAALTKELPQAKLIASLLTQRQFLEQIQDILEPKFFESDSNSWLVKEIKKYFTKYKNWFHNR